MNTKRQTIWLVSMLSIMVVLSAYYLFTSDADDLDTALNDDMVTRDIVLNATELTDAIQQDVIMMDDLEVSEILKSEEQILQEVQNQQQSSFNYFTNLHLERDEAYAKELERLYAITVTGTADAVSTAHDEIYQIEDEVTKLSHLEELIMVDFANAIITEEDSKWKVYVQADKMEKSQAVSIIDMVMQEMNAGPNEVVVQFSP